MKLKPLVACLALAVPLAFAQQPALATLPPSAYNVQFTLHETQPGQAAVSHTYTLVLKANGGTSSISVGNRVRIPSGPDNFTYQSVGFSLNCALSNDQRGLPADQVALTVQLSLSSLAANASPSLPTIQSTDTHVVTAVPIGQRVSISQFQDVASPRVYQLEVLATPLPVPPAR